MSYSSQEVTIVILDGLQCAALTALTMLHAVPTIQSCVTRSFRSRSVVCACGSRSQLVSNHHNHHGRNSDSGHTYDGPLYCSVPSRKLMCALQTTKPPFSTLALGSLPTTYGFVVLTRTPPQCRCHIQVGPVLLLCTGTWTKRLRRG